MQRLLFRFAHQYGTRPVRYVLASPARNYSDDLYTKCKKRRAKYFDDAHLSQDDIYYSNDTFSDEIPYSLCKKSGAEYSDEIPYSGCKQSGAEYSDDLFWSKDRNRDSGKKLLSSVRCQGDKSSHEMLIDKMITTYFDYSKFFGKKLDSDNKHLSDEIPYSGCKQSGAEYSDDLYLSKERNRDSGKKLVPSVGGQGNKKSGGSHKMIGTKYFDFPKYSDDIYYSGCKQSGAEYSDDLFWSKERNRNFGKKLMPLVECQGDKRSNEMLFVRYYSGDKIITTCFDYSKIFGKKPDSDNKHLSDEIPYSGCKQNGAEYSDDLYLSKERNCAFGNKLVPSVGCQGNNRSGGSHKMIGAKYFDFPKYSDDLYYFWCKKSGAAEYSDDLYRSKKRNRDFGKKLVSSVGCQGDKRSHKMIGTRCYSGDKMITTYFHSSKNFGKKLDSDNKHLSVNLPPSALGCSKENIVLSNGEHRKETIR